MIIDPFVNHLNPLGSREDNRSEGSVMAGANTKHGEVNVRRETSPNIEDIPPPYTEVDLERGIIEGLEIPLSVHRRFWGMDEDKSGIQHIKEGTQIFYYSVMFFVEASLFTLGICVGGIGKILCGIGMIIKHHRTLCHPVLDN